MSSYRVWLFRSLVAIGAGLMVVSFIMPWWSANISEVLIKDPIRIYGYGLRHELRGLAYLVAVHETPFYQTVLAWIYLAGSVGLILYNTWLRGRKGRWLLGGIGLIYIAYAAIATIEIAIGTADSGVSLQGYTVFKYVPEWPAIVNTSLRFGYYLAYAAGLMCIALALLRDRIIGKSKPGA